MPAPDQTDPTNGQTRGEDGSSLRTQEISHGCESIIARARRRAELARAPAYLQEDISDYGLLLEGVPFTTILVSTRTRDRLKRLATKGETYDDVLLHMIETVEDRMLYDRERRILETEEFVPLGEA